MKNTLFLLSLLFIFIISCGDSEKLANSPKNGEDSGNNSENSNENGEVSDFENAEVSESDSNSENNGQTEDQVDPDGGYGGGETLPEDGGNGETNPVEEPVEEPFEEPDEDKPSENTAKYCIFGCNTASDCVPAGANAITDADNYKCEDGKCVYLGCLSDAECDEIYGAVTAANGKVYRCNKNGAYGYPECTPVCSNAADCNLYGDGSTQYAYDLDNYKCESGFCVFTGCNSDAECEATMPSSDYKCQPQEYSGKTLKICTLSCKSAADCANSVYPKEFYECRNSQCVTKNCESDEWCQTYMTDDYVCK